MPHTDTQMSNPNANAFSVFRAGCPADLDTTAIETDTGLRYSWRDWDRATAMVANLFVDRGVSSGARIICQRGPSVEAAILRWACWRGGWVWVPMDATVPEDGLVSVIQTTQAEVLVCSSATMGVWSKRAFQAGTRHVFTLNDDRRGTLLDRASQCIDVHEPTPCQGQDPAVLVLRGAGDSVCVTHGQLIETLSAQNQDRDGRVGQDLLRFAAQ
jgi:malonyl-CoA/methylmalonyl-CoA synthetase